MKNEKKEVEKKVENEKNEIVQSGHFSVPCIPDQRDNRAGSADLIDTMSFFPTFSIFHPILLTREQGQPWHACVKDMDGKAFLQKPYFISHLYTRESVRVLGADKKYKTALKGTAPAQAILDAGGESGFTSLIWVSGAGVSTFATLMIFSTGKSYWKTILKDHDASEEKKAKILLVNHAENLYKNEKTGNAFLRNWKEGQYETLPLTEADKKEIIELSETFQEEIINFVN